MPNENGALILLGITITLLLVLVFRLIRRAKKGARSRYSGDEYGTMANDIQFQHRYAGLSDSEARKRKELMSLGLTGRSSPKLDVLNRKLTNSLSADEIRRRIREREADGKPTGQLRAAARDRDIHLD